MLNYIKSLLARQREARDRRMRLLKGWIDGIMGIYLPEPHGIFIGIQDWVRWGKMQTKILSCFSQQWPETHVYLWYRTLVPDWIVDHVEAMYFEHVEGSGKDEHIFIFPDCPNQHLQETILSFCPDYHFSKAVFVLDYKPENWKEAVTGLLTVAKELSRGRSVEDFKAELSHCHCLCYSEDNDLVIAKVDLPENIVKSILENVFREYNFDLAWHQGRPKWARKITKEDIQMQGDFWEE